MEFRPITELSSCKGRAYDGELIQCCIKIPRLDWDALKAYARDNGTSAGEIVRVLARDFLRSSRPRYCGRESARIRRVY